MLDFIMEHEKAKKMVDEKGWDNFLEVFQEQYSGHNLYCVSTHWHEDSKYICKFRGTGGDIVMGWDGVHNRD